MPTTSVIKAVMTKYAALTAANFPGASRPPMYLDEAPRTDSGGSQEYPPYVVLRDGGLEPTYAGFERHTLEVNGFTLEIYYPDDGTTSGGLAAIDIAAAAIKLNGGTRDQANGFDLGTLSDLTSPRSTHQVLRVRETRRLSGYGRDGKPVYVGTLEYRVTIQENP